MKVPNVGLCLAQVGLSEGRDLGRQYNVAFHEVSVADAPIETIAIMNRIVKQIWRQKVSLPTSRWICCLKWPSTWIYRILLC